MVAGNADENKENSMEKQCWGKRVLLIYELHCGGRSGSSP